MEEGCHKYQQWPHDKLQKWELKKKYAPPSLWHVFIYIYLPGVFPSLKFLYTNTRHVISINFYNSIYYLQDIKEWFETKK